MIPILSLYLPYKPEEWLEAKIFTSVQKYRKKYTYQKFFLNFQHESVEQYLPNTSFAHLSSNSSNIL